MNLGTTIKELRKHKYLSQEELSERAGISPASLERIENGKKPRAGTLKKISYALDIPESIIFSLDIEKADV